MAPFDFPALPAGPPSRRNWYLELLEHPKCLGNPQVIHELYDSHRKEYLQKQIDGFAQTPPLKPASDAALLAYLADPAQSRDDQDVNCMVIWTRPPTLALAMATNIQTRIRSLLGDAVWLIPKDDLHLSVLELSHRHSVRHLQGVLDNIGNNRMKRMLSVPSVDDKISTLVRPQVVFDKLGLALTVVPSADDPFTYHHLRAELQTLALESGIEIDTCYTALSAHVTLARFVNVDFFDRAGADEKFLDLINWVNELLAREYGEPFSFSWQVSSLELQKGYLKFGRPESKKEVL